MVWKMIHFLVMNLVTPLVIPSQGLHHLHLVPWSSVLTSDLGGLKGTAPLNP